MHDMIVTGGENVYPREVEDVLHSHPAVLEAAVFAAPNENWVDAVVAAVVVRRGTTVTAEELVEHCRGQLASYKKPRRIMFVDELPKNASGKILRREMRSMVASIADQTAGAL
jgi:acyl-CoA synthetase (AMP-forming)/AMP-acid ligase II